ncbi:SUMF1/EgtB/PvdO family nonheme iron enzyme [Fulvitalea axinellae]|uniref:SUMF1/EgtB/PvdO family nonheme iron enzyme n=1 Tax=Fulvitalea axinellae TaxID=1182444 RepID=UPI0030CA503E
MLLFLLPGLTLAAKKKKGHFYVKRDTWEATMAASKKAYGDYVASLGFTPVSSGVLKHKQAAEPISVDVSGLSELILVISGGANGNSYDHGVWGNARLIDRKGNVTWLEDLDWVSAKSGWRKTTPGANLYGEKANIGGKKYEHCLTVHAEGKVVYKLDKKYAKFEAEVGVDTRGGNKRSSIIFQVHGSEPGSVLREVAKDFPQESGMYSLFAGTSGADYLTMGGTEYERALLTKVLGKLESPEFFRNEALKIKANGGESIDYLKLFKKVVGAIDAQDQLAMIDFEAMRLSIENMDKEFGAKYNGKAYLSELKRLESQKPAMEHALYKGDPKAVAWINKTSGFKRKALMANPLLDFDQLLVVRHKLGNRARTSGPNAPDMVLPRSNWKTIGSTSNPSKGWDTEIAVLSNLRGGVDSKTLYKPKGPHAITDLDLHFDAGKVMFTSATDNGRWGLFEVNIDGSNVKQLSPDKYPDLDFYDACYLPDGRVAMVSNVSMQGVPCVNGSDPVGSMCLLDPETRTFKQINFGQDNDWDPVVLSNGRIMYLRWEYTDNVHYFTRVLMHMNPDGTGKKEYYGSASYWPNTIFDAKPIPGHKTKLVGIVSGHHGTARSGELVIFDPAKGRQEADGVVQRIPGRGQKVEPIIKDKLVDGVWPQFTNPYPLDDNYYLVTAKMKPGGLWGLYLVDTFDNLTLVKEYEGEGIRDVFPLKKRPTPPVIPDKIKPNAKDATVYIADVYEGQGLKGVKRGSVKELRVFAYKFAYNTSKSNNDAMGIEAAWDVKRVLGTVPVYEDGSAMFKIPANVAISLQPLDEHGQAMQIMRSWLTAMPGETISCIGCHEDQNTVPVPKRTIASNRSPVDIKPFYGEVRPFSFVNEVQPVLDAKCVGCHNGNDPELPNFADKTTLPYRNVSRSYFDLQKFVRRPGPESDLHVLTPMDFHASTSEVIMKLNKGHHNVKLTKEERDRLVTWIDLNVPYHADFHDVPDYRGSNQKDRRVQLMKEINNMEYTAEDELARANALREARGPIQPIMPETAPAPKYKKVKARNWPFDATKAKELQAKVGTETKKIDLGNGQTIELVKIPAGEFVMGSDDVEAQALPKTRVKVKKSYWMAKYEISNGQFRSVFPEHNSRVMDQQWKDHTRPGYEANRDEQPAIRMSWQEAQAFCEELSKKTGLKVKLPTEAQWEWACRAGSDKDMAFGDQTADFTAYANFADESLQKMAVIGVDPKPMNPNHTYFKYYDYIPRASGTNDNSMLQSVSGKYKPNAWGLYDMHGNVAEWTRSDYVPYPYNAKDGRNAGNLDSEKTVRGGSWKERPRHGAAGYRNGYKSWQKVYNVGFRVVIEE